MSPTVATATRRHADAIRGLAGLSPAAARLLQDDLDAADRCCLVACVGDEVVGYAAARLQPDLAEILDVTVAPSWRRQGVATALLTVLIERASRRGATAATLEVRAGNTGAQALYRRLGFRVEGRRPRYYPDGEDALLLWRGPQAVEGAHVGHDRDRSGRH